jgi:hypothetical protein
MTEKHFFVMETHCFVMETVFSGVETTICRRLTGVFVPQAKAPPIPAGLFVEPARVMGRLRKARLRI